jgi:hypothetical protein
MPQKPAAALGMYTNAHAAAERPIGDAAGFLPMLEMNV